MSFLEIDKIFGKVLADWSAPHGSPLNPFLFCVHAPQNDRSSLKITVTDFQSNTFQATKSYAQLEDMRDAIGIGGSWSEFIDYITASLKSDVKFVLEGISESGGASHAKLIAQKEKGMPRVSFPLGKLVDGSACKAMGQLSLELYTEYNVVRNSLTEEKENGSRLTKLAAEEREKNSTTQKQLDIMMYPRKHKEQKLNDRVDTDTTAIVARDAPDKQVAQNPSPSKVSNRVVPAHRRSKTRGVVLEDTEND